MWERISTKYEKGKIPSELKPFLKENCIKCGRPRIGNEDLTEVKCISYDCVKYVKNRAKDMFEYLGVKGIGPETSESLIYFYKAKSHMELIPAKFEAKPRVYLWEIAKLACIPGFSGKLEDLLAGYSTFTEYFEKELNIPPMINTFKQRLIQFEEYFTLKPALSKEAVVVMITGHITGYTNKQEYVNHCNELFGAVVKTTMRKSVSANFLITQNPNSGTEKNMTAKERGIPVITPNEYMVFLLYKMNPSNKELARVVGNLGKEKDIDGDKH